MEIKDKQLFLDAQEEYISSHLDENRNFEFNLLQPTVVVEDEGEYYQMPVLGIDGFDGIYLVFNNGYEVKFSEFTPAERFAVIKFMEATITYNRMHYGNN
jgi:hypothetical protein